MDHLIKKYGIILESDVHAAREKARRYGNRTELMAAYSKLKREFNQQNRELFDEDNKFLDGFREDVLEKKRLQAEEGDDQEKLRYLLHKDRYELQQKTREDKRSIPIRRQEIRKRLQEGDLTQNDLKEAQELARLSGGTEDISIFSQIKRQVNAQEADESTEE